MIILGKAFMLFFFQLIILGGVNNYTVSQANGRGGAYVSVGYFSVFMACFVSCFIVHLVIQPSVDDVFERIMYLYAHPEKFDNLFLPMSICFMKLCIDLFIQVSNILCELSLNNELLIAMCFSAMGVVADIDHSYYQLMKANDLDFQLDKSQRENKLPMLREARFDLTYKPNKSGGENRPHLNNI